MKKLYCEEKMLTPIDDDINKEWLVLATMADKALETLNDEDYTIFINWYHNSIRETYDIPNKICALCTNEERTEASIILFPKEPDGNRYKIFMDEETKIPYILIEEKGVNHE